MQVVQPEVIIIGETKLDIAAIRSYLDSIGANEYHINLGSDPLTLITEVMGRLCYRSWQPNMNPNVTRVRQDQVKYIQNLIDSGHGSVFEHATVNFILQNVSRVFTHELVRHRVGTAFSQESQRYVRLTDIPIWFPPCISYELPVEDTKEFYKDAREVLNLQERLQQKWVDRLELVQGNFELKKRWTSALRRYFSPTGVATSIGFSANIRELRHIIKMRTDSGAEEEMQIVIGEMHRQLKLRYPILFADASS